MKTHEEIVEKLRSMDDDIFGAESGRLLSALQFGLAKEFLKDATSDGGWVVLYKCDDDVLEDMKSYMGFAIEKAGSHRGLSAERSIGRFRGLLFLLGNEDLIDEGRYMPYGVPILKDICDAYGFQFPDTESMKNMSNGMRCHPDCSSCYARRKDCQCN